MSVNTRKYSLQNKIIFDYVSEAFEGTPDVERYADKTENLKVDILYRRDQLKVGATSYSTLGLSDFPMRWATGEFPTRLELAGVCSNSAIFFRNVLASAAFGIMRTGHVYYPGAVMPNYVRLHSESSPPHLYLTSPFLWKDKLRTRDCSAKKVSWLLAVPISNAEYEYLKKNGHKALENLLERNQVQIDDLGRPSVV